MIILMNKNYNEYDFSLNSLIFNKKYRIITILYNTTINNKQKEYIIKVKKLRYFLDFYILI